MDWTTSGDPCLKRQPLDGCICLTQAHHLTAGLREGSRIILNSITAEKCTLPVLGITLKADFLSWQLLVDVAAPGFALDEVLRTASRLGAAPLGTVLSSSQLLYG